MALRRREGFTLVEVLAAAALFAVLGVMLFGVLRNATDIWTTGERNRDLLDRAGAVLDLLAEDLRHAWPGVPGAAEQDARFLCSWREADEDGDGVPESRCQVLRFTRLCHEARKLSWVRRAGERAGAQGVATLLGERDPAALRPTGGLAESLYALVRRPGQTLPSLLRRFRAPAGGEGSLVEPDLPDRSDRLLTDAMVVADGVLHFGLQFWAPGTVAWEDRDAPAPTVWDSTRSLLPAGDPTFPPGSRPGSLFDGSDDVLPALVRVQLVLDASLGSALLVEAVSAEAGRLLLSSTALLREEGAPDHLRLDAEWLRVLGVKGREVSVQRAARGTLPAAHAAGARARVGRTFERLVRVPAAREAVLP